MKSIKLEDVIMLFIRAVLYGASFLLIGPYSLAFLFLLMPRAQESAEEHGREGDFFWGSIIVILLLVLAWYLTIAWAFGAFSEQTTGC